MLSFDLSVIDIVLAVAVVALLLLFMIQKRSETIIRSQPQTKEYDLSQKTESNPEIGPHKPSTVLPDAGFQKCTHSPGFLAALPENTPVPDECSGCPKTLRCLFPSKQH